MLARFRRTILLIPVLFLTGCAMLESGKNSMLEVTRMARPRPYDNPSENIATEDEWGFVGEEGRNGMPRERDNDRWWKNSIMSQRARDIETSLGID